MKFKILLYILIGVLIISFIISRIFKNKEYFSENELVIYILTRTSKRPKFYENCKKSLLNQSFKYWKHLVSYDDEDSKKYIDTSVSMPINVKYIKKNQKHHCPYNLYFNELIKHVPKNAWILFMDDDSVFFENNSLKNLVEKIKIAESSNKSIIISSPKMNSNNSNNLSYFQNNSYDDIKNRMESINKSYTTNYDIEVPNELIKTDLDTSQICIKNDGNLPKWVDRCGGDKIFFADNILMNKKFILNNNPVLNANYNGPGRGRRDDL